MEGIFMIAFNRACGFFLKRRSKPQGLLFAFSKPSLVLYTKNSNKSRH